MDAFDLKGFNKGLNPGAQLTGEKSVADGKFITGRGAGAAGEFGLKIVEKLKGKELSDKLRRDMQY